MTTQEITERTQRIGAKGVDMRTAITDVEMRLERPMSAPEHQAFLTGWKAAGPAREERRRQRDLSTAVSAFPGVEREGAQEAPAARPAPRKRAVRS